MVEASFASAVHPDFLGRFWDSQSRPVREPAQKCVRAGDVSCDIRLTPHVDYEQIMRHNNRTGIRA